VNREYSALRLNHLLMERNLRTRRKGLRRLRAGKAKAVNQAPMATNRMVAPVPKEAAKSGRAAPGRAASNRQVKAAKVRS